MNRRDFLRTNLPGLAERRMVRRKRCTSTGAKPFS